MSQKRPSEVETARDFVSAVHGPRRENRNVSIALGNGVVPLSFRNLARGER